MNLEYGGKEPDVTRVIYSHGTFDGWTKVATEVDFGIDNLVIMIQGSQSITNATKNHLLLTKLYF
jgi:hypothetical protein